MSLALANDLNNYKNYLLSSLGKEILLHGDLHHDNIILHGEEWFAIDPKGIIGEPEFAAFDFIHSTELNHELDAQNLFVKIIKLIGERSNLNIERIKQWTFVRLILAAAWSIEDNMDANQFIKLASTINECL